MKFFKQKSYDSLNYVDLLLIAQKKNIKTKEVPFRGAEYDPQLICAREILISKLESIDAKNRSNWSIVIAILSLIAGIFH